MLRRAPALLLALALATGGQAQDRHQHSDEHALRIPGVTPDYTIKPPTPWLTGAQLLQLLDPPPGAADRQVSVEAGMRYVMGVFDASVGKDFCYTDDKRNPTPKPPPAALRATVVAGLRAPLPRGQTLKDRASAVIIGIFQGPWPCPPDWCCHD